MEESFVDELNAELSAPQSAMSVEAPKESKAKGFLSQFFNPRKEEEERTIAADDACSDPRTCEFAGGI